MPETPALSWRTVAAVSLLPIVLIAVLLALVLRGKDTTSVGTIGSSSSSVSSTSNAASSIAAPSSAPTVAFAGPVAPFDACPGIPAYSGNAWYADMKKALFDNGLLTNITEACMSADFVIGTVHMENKTDSVIRYDLHTKTLLLARQTDGRPAPVASSFGKRSGDLIPLMVGTCRSGTYNVRENTVVADGSDCSRPYCSGGEGQDYWPSAPAYAHLTHLGPVFTAEECGADRLKQVLPQGTFTVGSTIFLKAKASAGLEQALTAAGYSCDDADCIHWRNQSRSIPVSDLLLLKPYIGEMRADDCYYCG